MIGLLIDEGLRQPRLRKQIIKKWITNEILRWGKTPGDITYLFCDDEKILEVNKKALNHDYYTDIITFDYCEGKVISGDLLISLDTVKSNAETFHVHYSEELHRVMIHGILHLLGLKDKTIEEQEAMRRAEDEALGRLRALIGPEKTLFK